MAKPMSKKEVKEWGKKFVEDFNKQQEGKKFDTGKPRWSLLPNGVVRDVIQVLEYGAVKYGTDNWKHVPDANRRYYDAAMRHLDEWQSGGEPDAETGQSHLAHAVCCLMFLMWIENNGN